jgi:uncharacterized protein YndB with AHSA1/START domain
MGRTDEASLLVEAPRARIFTALLDKDARETWLPPAGMTGRLEWFEPRAGGGYRLVLTHRDATGAPGKTTGDTDVVEAQFVELAEPERVVERVVFVSDDPAFAGTMTMSWLLAHRPGGTEVTCRATDVPEGIPAEDHRCGISSSLAQLAAYVED